MSRHPTRQIDGIVLLDKPAGLTSNQALQACRRLFGAAKAGHTGSLDPMATGLLPICLGEATKIAGLLLGSRKAYDAECLLGTTTDTDDADGRVLASQPVPPLDDARLQRALDGFVGHIQQVPPAYSALKREGVAMYARARRGETVQLAARPVHVHAIELLGRAGPRLRLRITCGSGTYIRSLARDLGAQLGCGGHLTALRRLWVEPFVDPAMHGLERLQELATTPGALDRVLLPVDAGLAALPAVRLDAAASAALAHGQAVRMAAVPPRGRCRAYAADGRLLALAEVRADGCLHAIRGFRLPAPAA